MGKTTMKFSLNSVSLQGPNHRRELGLEQQVHQLLLPFFLFRRLSRIVHHSVEGPFEPKCFLGFGRARDVEDCGLELGHDDLVLDHHVARLDLAQLDSSLA